MFKRIILYFSMLTTFSCTDEFMPEPVGEVIPAADHPSLSEALSSNGYTLFSMAWEHSNMDRILAQEYPQSKLLFLVPTDAAMAEAGYTEADISAAAVTDLDNLLRYHVLNGHITQEQLMASVSGQIFPSLLTHPEFKEGSKSGNDTMISVPYRYQHILQFIGDNQLMDNGKLFSTEDWLPVEKGAIVPLDKIAERPTKQMIDVLREDGRFSLFVRAMELNGSLYDAYTVPIISPPAFSPYKYITDWYAFTEGGFRSQDFLPQVIRFTLFAPIDAAFHEIGIHTEEDLRLLNARSQVQFSNASTPSDSLLVTHRISRSRLDIDIDWNAFVPGIYTIAHNNGANAVFYDRSLNNRMLGNYVIEAGVDQPIYLDYDFGTDASGRITIQERGSVAEPATVIEENMNTIQGPIHVVDRLIVPKDFSMWHITK